MPGNGETKIKRLKTTVLTLLVCVLAIAVTPQFASADTRPDILVYVDDLGWQDVQFNDLDAPCPCETPSVVTRAK